ncbi:MAG: DNA-binding response regulator [Bdellovibrionales bacterium CG10_big_fil_rev_8_21_14_0_10_45_34]|nr:MAG: DNA-binding response regulator [Bdellovibrionales bacterium CG10_big_fil_rev_8_21_14_0_10_45_34]
MGRFILLVEDDLDLGANLQEALQSEGYQVEWIRDGKQGLKVAQNGQHDLVVLDLMLPRCDGFEILDALRKNSQKPVFMISAQGAITTRLRGLEGRADDYLVKPFHLNEFLLRVRNIIWRSRPVPTTQFSDSVSIGQAVFDLSKMTVFLPHLNATEVLSPKETGLLKMLLGREGHVVTRDEILDTVWGVGVDPSPRTIDNFVLRLRKWIEPNPKSPQHLISHRGAGYRLHIPGQKGVGNEF